MSKKWIEMAHEQRAHIFPTFWYWESVQYVGREIGVEPGVYANYYKNHEMSYLTKETGFTQVGKEILRQIKEERLIDKIEACNNIEIDPLITHSRWFCDKDLSHVDGTGLFKQYTLVHDQFMKLMSYSAMGTVMEFEVPLLSNELEDVLRDKVEDTTTIGDYFNILTTPTRLTVQQQEEIELRKLRIQELSHDLTSEELSEHTHAYSYIAFGYDGPGWSVEEVRHRLHDLSDDVMVLQKQIEDIQSVPDIMYEKQQRVIQELELSEQEAYLFSALSILGYWKFERKLANQKSHEMMEFFFEELMRRFNLSKAQAKSILPQEMEDVLLHDKLNKDILNARIQLSIAIFDGYTSPVTLIKEEALHIEREIEQSLAVDQHITELLGSCAYPGIARGSVSIVNDENDLGKFKPGNIVVSTSTTPKIISAMKQASAIVTDSGGITCHAAIVARELHVPCVIGTKIATRVLKDGDDVEVNATNGIIKRL